MHLIGPLLIQGGFIPIERSETRIFMHRPIEAIRPCPELPTIGMNCRTLEIQYDPFDMWAIELDPDEMEDFDKRWHISNNAIPEALRRSTQAAKPLKGPQRDQANPIE